jgi:mycothiol system anti-sigma-R factor
MNCNQALQQLWDYLDQELTDEKMVEVRHHLEICQSCFPHYDFERAFLDAIASTRNLCEPPASLRVRVMESLCAAGFTRRK